MGWEARCRILVEKAIENFIMVTTIFLQRNWHKNVSTNFLRKALENCGQEEMVKWSEVGRENFCASYRPRPRQPMTSTPCHE